MEHNILGKISPFFNKTVREYQKKFYEVAVQQNTVLVLPTGSGKTLISTLVAYHFISHPEFQKKFAIYLCPTRALAFQQYNSIVDDLSYMFPKENVVVQLITGEIHTTSSTLNESIPDIYGWNHVSTWKTMLKLLDMLSPLSQSSCRLQEPQAQEELCKASTVEHHNTFLFYNTELNLHILPSRKKAFLFAQLPLPRIFVMTPEVLLSFLTHAYFTLSNVSLLVFDECHNVFGKSPYREIMQVFYHENKKIQRAKPLTRILGLTATPFSNIAYMETNLSILRENIYNNFSFIESVYDSRLEFGSCDPPKANENCFYISTTIHRRWTPLLSKILWEPFFLIVEMNPFLLEHPTHFLKAQECERFLKEMKDVGEGGALPLLYTSHSEFWAAFYYVEVISKDEQNIQLMSRLRKLWHESPKGVRVSLWNMWRDRQALCDSVLNTYGLWSVLTLLMSSGKRRHIAFKEPESTTDAFNSIYRLRHELREPHFLHDTLEKSDFTSSLLEFDKWRRKISKLLIRLFFSMFRFFTSKTHLDQAFSRLKSLTLFEAYRTNFISPKVVEMERLVRALFKRFQSSGITSSHTNAMVASEIAPSHSSLSQLSFETTILPQVNHENPDSTSQHNPETQNSLQFFEENTAAAYGEKTLDPSVATILDATSLIKCPIVLLPYKNILLNNVVLSVETLVSPTSALRCLIFCQTRLESWLLQQYCELRGIPRTAYVTSSSQSFRRSNVLSVLTKNTEQREILKRFSQSTNNSSEYLNILFCTTILMEGCDLTNCNCAISFAPIRSILNYIQSKGRIRDDSHHETSFFCISADDLEEDDQPFLNTFYMVEKVLWECTRAYRSDFKSSNVAHPLKQNVLYNMTTQACISENSAFGVFCSLFVKLIPQKVYQELVEAYRDLYQRMSVADQLQKPWTTLFYTNLVRCLASIEFAIQLPFKLDLWKRLTALCDLNQSFSPREWLHLLDDLHEQKVIDDHFLLNSDYQNDSKPCYPVFMKEEGIIDLSIKNITNVEFLWREPCRMLCPCNLHFSRENSQFDFQTTESLYSLIQWIFQNQCLKKKSLSVICHELEGYFPNNPISFAIHNLQELRQNTEPWLVQPGKAQLISFWVHRVFCCLESFESMILASGGFMGLWKIVYTEDNDLFQLFNQTTLQPRENNVSLFDNLLFETCFSKTSGHPLSTVEVNNSMKNVLETIKKLSGSFLRVLLPFALLLPTRLPETVVFMGCHDAFGEMIRVEIEPLQSPDPSLQCLNFTWTGILSLLSFNCLLLSLISIKDFFTHPFFSSSSQNFFSPQEHSTPTFPACCADLPLFFLAPLASDGMSLDLHFILSFLNLHFLCLSQKSKTHRLAQKNLPTLFDYIKNAQHSMAPLLEQLTGGKCSNLIQPERHIFHLLPQLTEASRSLISNAIRHVETAPKNKETVTGYHVPTELPQDVISEATTNLINHLLSRGLEPPVVRLIHDQTRPYRYAGVYGLILHTSPSNFFPLYGTKCLTDMEQTAYGFSNHPSRRQDTSVPIVIGHSLRQGSRNLFIDSISFCKKSINLSHFDSRYACPLPLTDPMFQQLTWTRNIIFKLDIWLKHYELTKKLEWILTFFDQVVSDFLQHLFQKNKSPLRIQLSNHLVSLAMKSPSSCLSGHEIDTKTPENRLRFQTTSSNPFKHDTAQSSDMSSNQFTSHFKCENNNQRLEFLGDSVLKAIAVIYSFFIYPEKNDGGLSPFAHAYLSNEFLKKCSCAAKLHSYLWAKSFTSNEALSDVATHTPFQLHRYQSISSKMQADTVEALIAAIYLSPYEISSKNNSCIKKQESSNTSLVTFLQLVSPPTSFRHSTGLFQQGFYLAALLFDFLTSTHQEQFVTFSFFALLVSITDHKILYVPQQCPEISNSYDSQISLLKKKLLPFTDSIDLRYDFNRFSDRLQFDPLYTVQKLYKTYLSYPIIIDQEWLNSHLHLFNTKSLPCTNDQILSAWSGWTKQEQYNENKGIITIARTPVSMINKNTNFYLSYERLEFLGDGILSLLIADFLYKNFPTFMENDMTFFKSILQSNCFLALQLLKRFSYHKNKKILIPASQLLVHSSQLQLIQLDQLQQDLLECNPESYFTVAEQLLAAYKLAETKSNDSTPPQTAIMNLTYLPPYNSLKQIADLYESLVGAIFLLSGGSLEECWKCISQDFQTLEPLRMKQKVV